MGVILAPKYRQQYAARWLLLDRLGSVVAEATGAQGADISELVSYAEYGALSFESVGYQNPYGFTGQPQDGGTGRVSFGSRDYDPGTAVWFAPDEWPGLLTAPQSLTRYAYVLGNPVTFADLGGYRPYEPGYSVTKNGSGWQYQKQAPKTVLNHSAWANHYGRQVASGWNAGNTRSYAVVGPSGQTQFMSARHATATRQCTASTVQSWVLCQQIRTTATILNKQVEYYKDRLKLMGSSSGTRVAANESVTKFALGVALSNGADCKVAPNGLIVCYAPNLNVQGGTTYGEVFITNQPMDRVKEDSLLLRHEQTHSEQWAAFGPLMFGSSYLGEMVKSQLTVGSYGCQNVFEIHAGLTEGRYQC